MARVGGIGDDERGGEDVADEPLIIGAGTNRRKIAAFFEGAAICSSVRLKRDWAAARTSVKEG